MSRRKSPSPPLPLLRESWYKPQTPPDLTPLHLTKSVILPLLLVPFLLFLLCTLPLPAPSSEKSADATTTVVDISENTAPINPHIRRTHLQPPQWCPALLKKPKKLRGSGCRVNGPVDDENCGATLEPVFPGQKAVDWFLYVKHFRLELWTRLKEMGIDWEDGIKDMELVTRINGAKVYWDVAANHAVRISNTYVMDRCLGWSGVCVEANERYFHELYKLRTCQLVPVCVSDKVERVRFVTGIAEGLSGVVSTNKNLADLVQRADTNTTNYRQTFRKLHHKIVNLNCIPSGEVLENAGVKHVHYMNLDVEGHEYKVLKGIKWDNVTIDIIGVEAPLSSVIHHFLKQRGYIRVPEWGSKDDWLYMRKDFQWGSDVYPEAAEYFAHKTLPKKGHR